MHAGFLGALLRRAEKDPDRVLISLHEGALAHDLTQAGLVSGAARWANLFRGQGAGPGDVVLISLPLCVALIDAFLGALVAGCVPSLMPCPSAKQDPGLFWSSHNALFARLGGGLIVTTAAIAPAISANIRDARMTILTPEDVAGVGDVLDAPIHPWQGHDLACLQHSSGTTGLKKGVMLSFDRIEAQITAYAGVLGLTGAETIVSWLPLYHDMGFVACFLLPLSIGGRLVLLDPFDWLLEPLALFDLIARYRGNFVWLPNFAFNHLVNAAFDDERRVDLGSVRAFIDCSEPCKPQSLAAFEARFRAWGLGANRLLTCYAMAETVFAISQSPPGAPPRTTTLDRTFLEDGIVATVATSAADGVAVMSSGHPLPGVDIAILDDTGKALAEGRVGQIAVRAPFLFEGYHLQPERSAAAFHDGFFLTGDLGFRLDEDLFVLGRRDDLLIILGRNLFANEVESILSAVPGIKPGRVLAMGLENDEIGSQELVVVAEPDGPDVDVARARAAIRSHLQSILGVVPRKIAFVGPGWLVKSTSGKLSRNANRVKYLAERGRL